MCEICSIERGRREVLVEWDASGEVTKESEKVVTTMFMEHTDDDLFRLVFGTFAENGRPIVEGDIKIGHCPFCGRKLRDWPTNKYAFE